MERSLALTWWTARSRGPGAEPLNPWAALTDCQLVAQAIGGRPDAYGELVRRYQTVVYNIAYRLVGERQDALDAAQETFVRAYSALHTFDQERPFGPWIGRVATNVALASAGRRRLPTVPLTRLLLGDDEGELPVPDPAVDPEGAYLATERQAQLRRAILALPPHYRAVIELRHFQDRSYEEIADALGLPLSDVKSHLFRARRLLRQRLEAQP
jgi:RNA polymerase sigma-70 factor (ECF subfamily)